MTARTLIIFVREPRAGAVKTRLGRGIGMVAAAWWYRHQTARLIRRLSPDRRWRTVLAVTPDSAVTAPAWPAGLPRIAQGRGDIGRRMARALGAMSPGPSVLIGSDVPAIVPADIADAFACLGRRDAVLGPAADGGFWLVGLRHPNLRPAGLFDGVRWSTRHALADTLASLRDRPAAFVRVLDDVDRAADLRRMRRHR